MRVGVEFDFGFSQHQHYKGVLQAGLVRGAFPLHQVLENGAEAHDSVSCILAWVGFVVAGHWLHMRDEDA